MIQQVTEVNKDNYFYFYYKNIIFVNQVIMPQLRRHVVIQKVEEQVQTKIANDPRLQNGNSNDQSYQAAPNKNAQQELSEINEAEYEKKKAVPKFEQMQTTSVPQAVMLTGTTFPKAASDALNPTEALSSDIELDKIIANLIHQQDVVNAQSNDPPLHKNGLGFRNQFSKPELLNSEAEIQSTSSPSPTASTNDELEFYKQLTKKLQNILQVKDGRDSLLNDLATFLNSEPEIPKRNMLTNVEMSNGFVPITTPTTPTKSSLQQMESQQHQSNTPVKLSKVYLNQNNRQQTTSPFKMEDSEKFSLVQHSNEHPGTSEEEIIEVLNSGEDKKIESNMEFADTKRPIYEMNDGRQIVEGFLHPTFHEEVPHPGSAQSKVTSLLN